MDVEKLTENLKKDKVNFESLEQENVVNGISRIKVSKNNTKDSIISSYIFVTNDGKYLIDDNILNIENRFSNNSPKLLVNEILEKQVQDNVDKILVNLKNSHSIDFTINYSDITKKDKLRNIIVIADINHRY